MENEQLLFTSASVLDLLVQIDELKDKDIFISDTANGFTVNIGESTYVIKPEAPVEVEVDEEVVDEVADAIIDTYEDMADEEKINIEEHEFNDEPVEGGPIFSLLKTLAVGGMVKMAGKALGKNIAEGIVDEAMKRRGY